MAIAVTQTTMTSDLTGTVATRQPDGRWSVTGREGSYTRGQAVTAMVIAQRNARGLTADNDPHVRVWEAGLLHTLAALRGDKEER